MVTTYRVGRGLTLDRISLKRDQTSRNALLPGNTEDS